jgi:hypothetical protein
MISLLKAPFKGCKNLTLPVLSKKTAFLLALATMCRGSELHALSVDEAHCRFSKGGVFLTYNPSFLAKNERANTFHREHFIPALRKVAHDEDISWCPVVHLREYLKRTQGLRAWDCNQLFIVTIDPFNPANKPSIARWIVNVIEQCYELARIPVPVRVKAHLVRAVAASTAFYVGFSLKQVLEASSWASENTFINCYMRDVASSRAGANAAPFLR